ncbi:MAG: biotin/lipoate A/B protein ligase family protein [Leptolyngbyaceae cyanobacterium bins.302]|nr:biotin/lipoate A/B protein ligase family protein [Leptolyngbyaceae cyanobacterium bins.302]
MTFESFGFMATWRLIPPFCACGSFQMALDSWLFEQHVQGQHPPTLRFYTWEPVAISLGYHQRQFPEHWHTLAWEGVVLDLVRRPTGGRAVLHQGDLTYAVITSGLSAHRQQAYQQLCEFLIQGWRSLGIELFYGAAGRGYIHNPNCFGTATAADLVLANGFKFIGSAQLRRGDVVLQHGSMRLNQSPELFQAVFGVNPQTLTFPHLLTSNHELILDRLVEVATDYWGIDFLVQPLSAQEQAEVTSKMAQFQAS